MEGLLLESRPLNAHPRVERRPEIVVAPAHIEPDHQPHPQPERLPQPSAKSLLPPDGAHQHPDKRQRKADDDDLLQRERHERRAPRQPVRNDRIAPRRIKIGHRPIEPASDHERQQQKADEITFSHRASSPHDSQIYEFPSISPASSSKQAFPEDEPRKLPAPSSKMAFIEDEMLNRPCSSSKNVLFEDGL